VRGTAHLEDAHHVRVDGTVLEGDQLLVALGSRPVIPHIPGLESVPYVTSDLLTSGEEIEMTELPETLLVLGGGYIALELGQMFSRFGTKVTVLERGPEILREYEPEIGSTLHEILEAEGVRVKTNTHVERLKPDGTGLLATLDVDGRPKELRVERLLVASGRTANTEHVGLECAGVTLTPQGWVKVDERLRTSVPNIWAAGDVIGQQHGAQLATPVGAHDGALAARNALSGEPPRTVDHTVVPRTIFTDPQVGVVGLTEAQAQARGIDCQCRIVEMKHVPRAGAVRATHGVIRMVAERGTDRVIGVSMLGLHAGEVIHEAAMAMRFHATIQDFIDMVHVYPTMAEALKIAALAFKKDITKLSCCAE
ncbi:MAG: FAD-dependent oxidoreductase, partial [Chloroflexota bacterium]|nr:FAD-dependent oxidoreductase [Chloroflexota bacterium]